MVDFQISEWTKRCSKNLTNIGQEGNLQTDLARIELLEAELQSRKDALKKLYGKVDQFPQKQKRLDAINENLGMRFNRYFLNDVFEASMISGLRCFRSIYVFGA